MDEALYQIQYIIIIDISTGPHLTTLLLSTDV